MGRHCFDGDDGDDGDGEVAFGKKEMLAVLTGDSSSLLLQCKKLFCYTGRDARVVVSKILSRNVERRKEREDRPDVAAGYDVYALESNRQVG